VKSNLDVTLTASYDYNLPKELIAKQPADPKDSAKLLIYDRKTKTIKHDIFRNVFEYVPKDAAFVLNDTKVIKARIYGHKQSGAKIELLLNKHLADDTYEVMIRGRVKPQTLLVFDKNLSAKVLECKNDGSRIVRFYRNEKVCDFHSLIEVLDAIGHVPLPPYIDRDDSKEDEQNYQTKFAKNYGAVAAPTASLHFTDALLKQMQNNHDIFYTTLHVGAGTFKPVEANVITNHPMHSEYFDIPLQTQQLLSSTRPIVAVGTTVTRTVEFFAATAQTSGECNLFLHPNNPPKRVDHLITNFHLPKSTLIMLVASFTGLSECMRIYEEAVAKRYRFFSYGDAMLIL
jgi:S-adenosylmethionine:tRNA ribosyltransferase-isomerase